MKLAVRLLSSFLLGVNFAKADPPVDPTVRVYCFRITDIVQDCDVTDRFYVEFQVLNWSNEYAGGVEVHLAQGSSEHIKFAYYNDSAPLDYDGVDENGTPLGDGQNRPPGNVDRDNSWTLTESTSSKMVWAQGTQPDALQCYNLQLAGPVTISSPPNGGGKCIPSATSIDGGTGNTGVVTPIEAVDNGDNVLDGFVMALDNFTEGSVAEINWFLTGAGSSAQVPTHQANPLVTDSSCLTCNPGITGTVIANDYGSGVISLTRGNMTAATPFQRPALFNGTWDQGAPDFFGDAATNTNGDCAEDQKANAQFGVNFAPTFILPFCVPGSGPLGGVANQPSPGTAAASCGGDPHFQTWAGQRFNYHGECDLVLAHVDSFQQEKGLDVHVRTKIEDIYSLITNAAVKLGEAILEVDFEIVGKPKFFKNGLLVPEIPYADDHFSISKQVIYDTFHETDTDLYEVGLGGGSVIKIFLMDKWVMMEGQTPGKEAVGAKGLWGSYPGGQMLGRDGITVLQHDRNAYGSQWQVQEDEPKLFRHIPEGHPQAPHEACKVPKIDANHHLRTEHAKMYSVAVDACMEQGVTGSDFDDCVFDVVVMNNRKIAAAWRGKEQKE